MIALSIGDPTVLSEMEKPNLIREIIAKKVLEKQNDAYTPSFGTEAAREAIAKYCSRSPHLNYKSKVNQRFLLIKLLIEFHSFYF
jgi:aspartate/methionine/tyrosine aminotransferase